MKNARITAAAIVLLSLTTLTACAPAATPVVITATPSSPPASSASPYAIETYENSPVRFSVSDPAEADIAYRWDFGDGAIGEGELVTHTFSEAGSYAVTLAAISAQGGSEVRETLVVQVTPFWPTEGWRTSTPEAQGMDGTMLEQMMARIDDRGYNIESVIVVRHGHIVLEEYRNGYTRYSEHMLQSVTKSYTSMLIGIALQQGLIESVDQRMIDFFPDDPILNMDPRKEHITLEHLLTMSVCMDWHELDYPYDDPRNTLGQMWVSQDAVQHVLNRPMACEPGSAWAYNSGTSIILGGILEQVTGQDVRSFAREHLFDPLGIGHVIWAQTTGNHYHTDGGLYMVPRDMARFGYLMLNNGVWEGQLLVPSDWVTRSTTAQFRTPYYYGYGYQWWTLPGTGVYMATGHYDQMIYVAPEEDLVVVFTANIADEDVHPTDMLLQTFILPACVD